METKGYHIQAREKSQRQREYIGRSQRVRHTLGIEKKRLETNWTSFQEKNPNKQTNKQKPQSRLKYLKF